MRDGFHRDEVSVTRFATEHTKCVDLTAVIDALSAMAADAVRAELDTPTPKDSHLALDTCERAVVVVDDQVISRG